MVVIGPDRCNASDDHPGMEWNECTHEHHICTLKKKKKEKKQGPPLCNCDLAGFIHAQGVSSNRSTANSCAVICTAGRGGRGKRSRRRSGEVGT